MQRLLRRSIVPPLAAAAPVAAGMYALRGALAYGGLASIAAWSFGALVTCGVLCWWLGFDDEERRFIRSQGRRLFVPISQVDDWEERP